MKNMLFLFTFIFAVSSVAFVTASECLDAEKEDANKLSCRRRGRRC